MLRRGGALALVGVRALGMRGELAAALEDLALAAGRSCGEGCGALSRAFALAATAALASASARAAALAAAALAALALSSEVASTAP